MSKIEDMVNALVQGEREKAEDLFNDVFSEKAHSALETFKSEVGQNFFAQPVKEEIAPSEVSQYEQDVKRTGKSHAELATQHLAYAKQMRNSGQTGLAVRSEMMAKDHQELASKGK